jgi:cell division protein FtsL
MDGVNKLVMKSKSMYVDGSTAYAPERSFDSPLTREEYEKLRKAKIDRANRIKQKKNSLKRKTILSIASVFVMGFGLIFGEAQVYGTQNKLTNLKKEIAEARSVNDDLKLQLAKVSSIGTIKETAEAKLQMRNPDRSTALYVDLSKDNFSPESKDNRTSKTKEVIGKIKNLLF